jgi:hypothetical protein
MFNADRGGIGLGDDEHPESMGEVSGGGQAGRRGRCRAHPWANETIAR